MRAIVTQIIKKTPLYHPLRKWAVLPVRKRAATRRQAAEIAEWDSRGRPVPPPHTVKQGVLREYSKRYGLRILVETGTYYGDMVVAMSAHFDRIYSIELSRDLYDKALVRCKGMDNVVLVHGDSGSVLTNVLQLIDGPALFWLDGHYSEGVTARGERDTPICEELGHILSAASRAHVIIVDDARCFGVDAAYPSRDELSEIIKSKRPDYDIAVHDDVIRITPGT